MRDAAALALLVAAIAVPRTTGFSIATVPAAPRLRARVCGRGALAVQAVLDKMGKAAIGAVGKAAANAPLPTSPRPQEILDAATTGEVLVHAHVMRACAYGCVGSLCPAGPAGPFSEPAGPAGPFSERRVLF